MGVRAYINDPRFQSQFGRGFVKLYAHHWDLDMLSNHNNIDAWRAYEAELPVDDADRAPVAWIVDQLERNETPVTSIF